MAGINLNADVAATGGYRIDSLQIKRFTDLAIKAKPISETDEATFQEFIQSSEEVLKGLYARAPDLSRNPAYQDYATVKVNGKVVATIDNNGALTTSNALSARLGDDLPQSVNGKAGPVLAQARADYVARLVGGAVEKAPTALSQSYWETIPTPVSVIDRAAMTADPWYANLQQLRRDRATFLAQQMAQDGDQN